MIDFYSYTVTTVSQIHVIVKTVLAHLLQNIGSSKSKLFLNKLFTIEMRNFIVGKILKKKSLMGLSLCIYYKTGLKYNIDGQKKKNHSYYCY